MRHSILFAAIALLAAPAAARGVCAPAFLSGDASVTIAGVEIAADGLASENLQLRVGNGEDGDDPCAAILRVSRVAAPADPDFPSYTLRAPGNQDLDILPDAAAGGTARSDIAIANAPSGAQGLAVPLQFRVPTEWGLRAGTYSEQLLVSLYDENNALKDTVTVTLTIVIPPAVSLRLAGAVAGAGGGPATVDLGTLSPTAETSSSALAARIFSTSAYSVSLSSDNHGDLLNENGRDRLPYRLYFDGRLVDLAGANAFDFAEHTPSTGDIRPLRIVVPPAVAAAGRYSDRVTVVVTAI